LPTNFPTANVPSVGVSTTASSNNTPGNNASSTSYFFPPALGISGAPSYFSGNGSSHAETPTGPSGSGGPSGSRSTTIAARGPSGSDDKVETPLGSGESPLVDRWPEWETPGFSASPGPLYLLGPENLAGPSAEVPATPVIVSGIVSDGLTGIRIFPLLVGISTTMMLAAYPLARRGRLTRLGRRLLSVGPEWVSAKREPRSDKPGA
jgi:hypothetical protein